MNIDIPFGTGKLEWWGYPMVKNEDMYNHLDSIPACDRRTDRQTSCHGIVRAMHTRHAVKIICRLGFNIHSIYALLYQMS